MKLFSKNRLFISLLSSTLSSAFLVSPGYGMLPEDEDERKLSFTQTTSLALSERLGGDQTSNEYYGAAQTLFYSNNTEEKEIGAIAFREMAKDASHPHHSRAVSNLFRFGSIQDKKVLAPLMRELIKDHNNPDRHSLASDLIRSDDLEDKEVGRKVLREIAQNPEDPNRSNAATSLFYSGSEEDKRAVAPFIRELVNDPHHLNRCNLAVSLFRSDNSADKKIGHKILLEIAANPEDPNSFKAVTNLFYGSSEEDKRTVTPILREVVKDPRNLNRYNFASILFRSNDSEDKEVGCKVLREIAANLEDPNSFNAVTNLFYGSSEEDKKIAVAILSKTVQDSTHPQYISTARCLMNQMEQLPEDILLNLLPLFSLEENNLESALFFMLNSEYSEIQKRAETIFLDNPLKFLKNYYYLESLEELFMQHEENKRDLWLQRICEAFQSPPSETATDFDKAGHFNATSLVLRMSDKGQFVTPAKAVFLNMMDTQLESFVHHAKPLLQSVKDVDFKDQIIPRLFHLARKIEITAESNESSSEEEGNFFHEKSDKFSYHKEALWILLSQNNEKIRVEAIDFCQKLIESMEATREEKAEKFLCDMGMALNTIEEGKELSQRILALLSPEFEQLLSKQNISRWGGNEVLEFFLTLGNEPQKLEIYNFCKKIIIEPEEEEEDLDAIDNIAELFTETIGENHPWTQELLDLATKRANINNEDSTFAIYKRLREKLDQPVVHNLPQFQLEDKRSVTFNLKTLQTKRQPCDIPMKHCELVGFTEKLLVEAEESPEEFKIFATTSLIRDPQSALEEVNKVFFKNLLDNDEESKSAQNVSLTSFKLRSVLRTAKDLHHQEGKEKEGAHSQGLPPSSQLILSLLNNVLTCPTGKDDGVDVTYRLLTDRRGGSEEDLQQDRLREETQEYFQEEMRCMREGLLNGDGPIVRALVGAEAKIDEPSHQAKQLGNLLGAEIGTFLEGKSITFDQNGGCVLPAIRECSKQRALDTLYQFHTPTRIIHYFHARFNELGFNGTVDGKNTIFNILGEFLTGEEVENPNYVILDDFYDPISITPLAIAEILIRANILEVLEND